MKTTAIGRQAESAAAQHLADNGYRIIDRNFRTRFCEIDLIAQKESILHFVEVKYRSSDSQGGGLDYITPQKLSQMKFAARIWIQQHDWPGDWRLMAAAVSFNGKELTIDEVLELD